MMGTTRRTRRKTQLTRRVSLNSTTTWPRIELAAGIDDAGSCQDINQCSGRDQKGAKQGKQLGVSEVPILRGIVLLYYDTKYTYTL